MIHRDYLQSAIHNLSMATPQTVANRHQECLVELKEIEKIIEHMAQLVSKEQLR